MAGTVATTSIPREAATTIEVSPITAAPSLTHQRDLRKRDSDTVGSATCGWVNGDLNTPLVCEYYNPCLWSPELHIVGCCNGAATTDCAWQTSCVPYAMVNNGCDAACQANYMNLVCDSYYPLCATATFGGPPGYTYLSCTDTPGPTDTMMLTYYGGAANGTAVAGLPRYFSEYWFSDTSTASSTGDGSTSTSDASVDHTISWFSDHKGILIGAIAGAVGLFFLLCVGCCLFRRRKASNAGAYRPASQVAAGVGPPVYSIQTPVEHQHQQPPEAYPMMGYQGYGGGGGGGGYYPQDYSRVYVQPNK